MKCFARVAIGVWLAMSLVRVNAAEFTVEVSDFRFSPEVLYVRAGDTVTWRGVQGNHNVNAENDEVYGDLYSGGPNRNLTFSYTFTQPDPEVVYASDSEAGMRAAIIVEPAFTMQANMTGAWYEPKSSGQGFVFEYLPSNDNLIVAWFTYDPADGSQQWFFGNGPMVGSTAELRMTRPEGGVFQQADPVPDKPEWGTLSIRFKDCNTAFAEYRADSNTSSGTMSLERISAAPECVQPGEQP